MPGARRDSSIAQRFGRGSRAIRAFRAGCYISYVCKQTLRLRASLQYAVLLAAVCLAPASAQTAPLPPAPSARTPALGQPGAPLTAAQSLNLRHLREAVPLTPRQKFALFGAFSIDPITFGAAGAVAGIEQGGNLYADFHQGARGYGRRYGTAYADLFTADFLGEALLPVLFRQDPRYFYLGEGTLKSRAVYAVSNSVWGRGDNHEEELNYSRLLGDLGSGAISNVYYPARNRGPALTFYNFGFGIAAQAATNLVQEFFVHKTTGAN